MTDTKLKKIIFILEELHRRADATIDSYDEVLIKEFENDSKEKKGNSPKQIGRLLDEIADELPNIQKMKKGRKNIYRLVKPIDLFLESFDNTKDISWVFNMVYDSDPELYTVLAEHTKKSSHIYQFLSSPFEDTKTLESRDTFRHLKKAVGNREYRKITFQRDTKDDLKCLKLVYMTNNWYIAYINDENKLLFGRISLIKKVDYASKVGSFQPSSVQDHLEFLKNIQNAMTLYDKPKKIAKLLAKPDIAKYFDEGMKLRLSSQKFEKKLDDGSIIFTIEYTQYKEILPLIQSWLPNLIILEPKELKEYYIKRLHQTIASHE